MQLVIPTTDKRNVRLENALDKDLKITLLQNVQSDQKIFRNGESKNIWMKMVIMHAITVKITVTKRNMHRWHVCMVMMNVLVEILVTVHYWPTGFFILGQNTTWHHRFQILFQVHFKIGIKNWSFGLASCHDETKRTSMNKNVQQ